MFAVGTEVTIELSIVKKEKADLLQSTVNRYLFSCGCHEGAIGAWIAILSLVVLFTFRSIPLNAYNIGLIISVIIIGSVIGKILGVFRARILLRKSIEEFKRSLQLE